MLRLSSVYLAVSQCDKKWRASLIDTPVFAFAGGRKARQNGAKSFIEAVFFVVWSLEMLVSSHFEYWMKLCEIS